MLAKKKASASARIEIQDLYDFFVKKQASNWSCFNAFAGWFLVAYDLILMLKKSVRPCETAFRKYSRAEGSYQIGDLL
jgi:hypothetical protein